MLIIKDSREKNGWDFTKFDECQGQIIEAISAGDYSLYGYENLIAIERKQSTNEIANNLGKQYDRFCREFDRMQKYKYKYCICEFTLENLLEYPKNSGLPKYKEKFVRMNGKFMLSRINDLETKYDVKFIFCGNRVEAEEKALELFKEALCQKV